MADTYQYVLRQLCASLNLTEPDSFEDVTSLQVGDYVCHLTEHPTDHLLMFCNVAPQDETAITVQNLFSQELCKPTLGLDPDTQTTVLWNRQSLTQMDRAMVHHQLEMLIHAAENLTAGEV